MQLAVWAKRDGRGKTFLLCGYLLPNGAMRGPYASWVKFDRLNKLTPDQREKFLPFCPEFVIEICSPSDSLRHQQAKMAEYIENGAQLGWLIDSSRRRVVVYRPGEEPQEIEKPETISGEPVLPGFVLDLREIW